MSDTADGQPTVLLFAQTAKALGDELARLIRYHIAGTRDLREIRKILAEPLDQVKNDYSQCGYFIDPESWDWLIKKRGDELEITAKNTPGMVSRTQFIFTIPLPSLH